MRYGRFGSIIARAGRYVVALSVVVMFVLSCGDDPRYYDNYNPCISEQDCTGGICSRSFAMSCSPGDLDCNGACYDVCTSQKNCGKCGNACAADEICTDGKCVK